MGEAAGAEDRGDVHFPVEFARALTLVKDGITAMAAVPTSVFSDAQTREAVAELFVESQRLESLWASVLRELDGRDDAVPGAKVGQGAATFLRYRLHRSGGRAKADVRAARLLDPDLTAAEGGLPAVGEAFAAGEISREHVDAVARAVGQISTKLRRGVDAEGVSNGEKIDEALAGVCRDFAPDSAERLANHLRDVIDPDRADRFDALGYERRTLSAVTDSTGMVVLRGQLDTGNGAALLTALDRFSKPGFGAPACEPVTTETAAEDRSGTGNMTGVAGVGVAGEGAAEALPLKDTRTAAQRRADALGLIACLALSSLARDDDGRTTSATIPRIVIHATPEQIAAAQRAHHAYAGTSARSVRPSRGDDYDAEPAPEPEPTHDRKAKAEPDPRAHPDPEKSAPGSAEAELIGAISPRFLAQAACDALLQRVLLAPDGRLLNLGRTERTISTRQRTALHARDRCCIIPGCGAPAVWCHGHHVTWWSRGGRTDIDNLCLLCPRHHTEVHLGIWDLQILEGNVWVKPPAWIDPKQRLIRNTTADATQRMRKLGQQLRLDLTGSPQSDTRK